MTEAVQVASITGVVTVVSITISGWFQSKKLDKQSVQAAIVEKKVDEVHTVVNNKSDLAANEIKDLKGQVSALTDVLASLTKTVKANGQHGGKV